MKFLFLLLTSLWIVTSSPVRERDNIYLRRMYDMLTAMQVAANSSPEMDDIKEEQSSELQNETLADMDLRKMCDMLIALQGESSYESSVDNSPEDLSEEEPESLEKLQNDTDIINVTGFTRLVTLMSTLQNANTKEKMLKRTIHSVFKSEEDSVNENEQESGFFARGTELNDGYRLPAPSTDSSPPSTTGRKAFLSGAEDTTAAEMYYEPFEKEPTFFGRFGEAVLTAYQSMKCFVKKLFDYDC